MRFVALCFVLLAGCASNPKLSHSLTPEEQEAQEHYAQELRNQCVAYGLKPETLEMAECVTRLHTLNLASNC